MFNYVDMPENRIKREVTLKLTVNIITKIHYNIVFIDSIS